MISNYLCISLFSREDAVKRLRGMSPGTFLIRPKQEAATEVASIPETVHTHTLDLM